MTTRASILFFFVLVSLGWPMTLHAQSDATPHTSEDSAFWAIDQKTRDKQYGEAIRVAKEFLELYPESVYIPNIHFNIATDYFSLGNYTESWNALDKFWDSTPPDQWIPYAYVLESGLYYKENDMVNAQSMLTKLSTEYPAFTVPDDWKLLLADVYTALSKTPRTPDPTPEPTPTPNTQTSPQPTTVTQPIDTSPLLAKIKLIPWEMISALLALLGILGGYLYTRSHKKNISDFINQIDDTYYTHKKNTKRLEAELYRFQDLVDEQLKLGKVNEGQYEILNKRIERYLKEIKEETLIA